MERRITTVFNPLARAAGFVFSEMGVSPTVVALFSFIAATGSMLLFLVSFSIPVLSPQTVLTAAVALIFLNAFLDSVERRVEVRRKKKSIFGGPLGTFLGQLSDAFIIIGVTLFLSLRDTYYNFGRLGPVDLSFVEPGFAGHMAWATALITGILVLRFQAQRSKEKKIGLWTRSERMYLLAAFAVFGMATSRFSGMLFLGVVVLTLSIYTSLFKRVFNFKTPKMRAKAKIPGGTRRTAGRGVSKMWAAVRAVLRGMLRLVGVLLLGIYILFERIYLMITGVLRSLLSIRLPEKKQGVKKSSKHPPLKPFEGTITPSPSGLPGGGTVETRAAPAADSESKHEPTESVEEPLIEFPPPTHLIEPDESYTGGDDAAESMIVEYTPSDKRETVILDIADFMVSEGKDIIIVSTEPSVNHFRTRFKDTKGIRVIDLPDTAATSPDVDEIAMTNLEYFSEVFEELTGDHVFIFEPLTSLVLHIGVAQSYRFVSQTLSRLSKMGVTFIVFMNKYGHDSMDISNFENLFMNLAEIRDGKLQKVR
ncbi:hypothetical protein BMS3Bbin16_00088 [archaeon BMS3Bbin16]|nr:hypothetical protein BMS3Bbin16_00088 [archaeon BMS3Bbin16]